MSHKEPITIVVADDHSFFRTGLVQVLHHVPYYRVVAEVEDGESLIEQANALNPDLMIVDIGMPKLDGIAATRILKKSGLKGDIIGLSMHTEEQIILEMLQAGALGYLEKNISKEELYKAIETVVHDKRLYFPASTSERLLHLMTESGFQPYPPAKIIFTPRELEVIGLTCADFTNKEIAAQLDLSKRTIETHKVRIMERMQVKSVAGLVAYAYTHGLIPLKNNSPLY